MRVKAGVTEGLKNKGLTSRSLPQGVATVGSWSGCPWPVASSRTPDPTPLFPALAGGRGLKTASLAGAPPHLGSALLGASGTDGQSRLHIPQPGRPWRRHRLRLPGGGCSSALSTGPGQVPGVSLEEELEGEPRGRSRLAPRRTLPQPTSRGPGPRCSPSAAAACTRHREENAARRAAFVTSFRPAAAPAAASVPGPTAAAASTRPPPPSAAAATYCADAPGTCLPRGPEAASARAFRWRLQLSLASSRASTPSCLSHALLVADLRLGAEPTTSFFATPPFHRPVSAFSPPHNTELTNHGEEAEPYSIGLGFWCLWSGHTTSRLCAHQAWEVRDGEGSSMISLATFHPVRPPPGGRRGGGAGRRSRKAVASLVAQCFGPRTILWTFECFCFCALRFKLSPSCLRYSDPAYDES